MVPIGNVCSDECIISNGTIHEPRRETKHTEVYIYIRVYLYIYRFVDQPPWPKNERAMICALQIEIDSDVPSTSMSYTNIDTLLRGIWRLSSSTLYRSSCVSVSRKWAYHPITPCTNSVDKSPNRESEAYKIRSVVHPDHLRFY